jgi:hypothetical protein
MESTCIKNAKGTIKAAIHTNGKYAAIIFGGSLKNFLRGPGADRIAIKKIFVRSKKPARFHNSGTIFGQIFFVKE